MRKINKHLGCHGHASIIWWRVENLCPAHSSWSLQDIKRYNETQCTFYMHLDKVVYKMTFVQNEQLITLSHVM